MAFASRGSFSVSPSDCTLTAVAASVRVASFQIGMALSRARFSASRSGQRISVGLKGSWVSINMRQRSSLCSELPILSVFSIVGCRVSSAFLLPGGVGNRMPILSRIEGPRDLKASPTRS